MMDELMQKIAACDIEIQYFFEALKEENRKLQKKIVELEFRTQCVKSIQIYNWPGGEKPWFSLYEAVMCRSCGSFESKSLFEMNFLMLNGNSSWSSWEEFDKDCNSSEIKKQTERFRMEDKF